MFQFAYRSAEKLWQFYQIICIIIVFLILHKADLRIGQTWENYMSEFMLVLKNYLVLGFILSLIAGCSSGDHLGIFTHEGSVGPVNIPGKAEFESTDRMYVLSGSGANIWGSQDAFHFLWKKTSGDLCLQTIVRWLGEGVNPHRKAGWMIRASLAPDAPYADVAVHGDGLISLQYRKEQGGETSEIKSRVSAPVKVQLERSGDLYSLSILKGEEMIPAGAVLIAMPDSVYAGLFVCSHEDSVIETAEFHSVSFENQEFPAATERILESNLETINITTGLRKIVYRDTSHFEAPNWSRDGKYLLYNSNGLLFRFDLDGKKPVPVPSGSATECNNDHGFSPDGKQIALSHHQSDESLIFTMPAEGGEPRLITKLGPSYWHGWSPDGKTLAYCAERNGEYDVYTIPAAGGSETRLTDAEGLDDGPDYSPDGRYIYFNSVRTGVMQIWRMHTDGSNQEQMTTDPEFGDWFPHPSPDGKWLVFLSYDKSVSGHPPEKEISLRLMNLENREITEIARFFGGQGTINVPSWSPDSQSLAYVRYRRILP